MHTSSPPPPRGAGPDRPSLSVHGVAAGSPLADALSRLAGDVRDVRFVAPAFGPLPWPARPLVPPASLKASDRAFVPIAGTREWRFEDAEGRPLFDPAGFARQHAELPRVVTVRAVERCGDATRWLEAHVGGRPSAEEWADKLARTAWLLASRLASDPDDGTPGTPPGTPNPPSPLPASRLKWEDRLMTEQWASGICDRSIGEILATGTLGPVRWLEPDDPAVAYYADPFGWPGRDDRILCERFLHATGVGDLVWFEPGAGRRAIHPIAPAQPTHRSYPCAWRENGVTFVMPESWTDGRTVIHRLEDDGRLVEHAVVAPGIGMADATLFRAGDRYWIAYTDTDIGHQDNLCLMHATDLRGPWTFHARNPVKIDVRSARCGGTVFEHAGALYRPAQDCSLRYGGALPVHRVVELDERRYREETAVVLQPDPKGPYPHGLHTLSVWGDRVLVDGKRMELRAGPILAKVKRRLSR